ncbi:MAG: glycoside hydrolase family 1 protein [Nocardioidaceae bacterium]
MSTTAPLDSARFPHGFVWGAATAAYQIEGAAQQDGRGPSIWDTFSRRPGAVRNGEDGDIACDHYHRLESDLDLIAALEIPSYRFSVSWPRVQPTGSGPVNQTGLDFYQRLVDGLLSRGIAPMLTLYHWDLPQALQDAGGWINRDTSGHFGAYAAIIAEALGDRVETFITLNEPWCSAFLGHSAGVHAPGDTSHAAAFAAAHHLNLAHGEGAQAIRANSPHPSIAVSLNLTQVYPAGPGTADRWAAEHVDTISNSIFLDPMLTGTYPQRLFEDTEGITDWAFVADHDLATICQPLDLLGINYYAPASVAKATPELEAQLTGSWVNDPAQSNSGPTRYPGSDQVVSLPQAGPYTDMGWPIRPDAFTELLMRVHRDHPNTPMIITENGCAYPDTPGPDGRVHDDARISYVYGHLEAVKHALDAGADIRGYYLWSLLDNFEWAWGYAKRFGIVHTDYQTLERTPKDSAFWYREVVRTNALVRPRR